MNKIKITYIGGGSGSWALHLMKDLALESDITGDLVLYDIDHKAAVENSKIAKQIFSHPNAKTSFKTWTESDLKQALANADFVICSIEPGDTSLRYADLEIPRKYGILQTVGDTTGPGGILRAARTLPAYFEFAKLIGDICPNAWVINYTNPMTLSVAALYKTFPSIKAFGCCHEVFGTQKFIAEKVKEWMNLPSIPKREEIELDICGVNHFTFATAAKYKGVDLFPYIREMISAPGFFDSCEDGAHQQIAKEEYFHSQKKVAFDFFRNFNTLGAAGDRHLVEFVPWYLRDENELHKMGVVRTPYEWRVKIAKEKIEKRKSAAEINLEPSGEEGVKQIKSLLGFENLVTNINIPNQGQINWLPLGSIVETNACLSHNSIRPILASEPVPGIKSLISTIANVQALTLEAISRGDKDLLFQAMLLDPLTTIPVDSARKMFDEMITTNKVIFKK